MSHMKGSVNYGQVADEIAQILADYGDHAVKVLNEDCLLYTSPSPRDTR